MSDGDRIPLEVNCVPLNAEHFAATQAVKGLVLLAAVIFNVVSKKKNN